MTPLDNWKAAVEFSIAQAASVAAFNDKRGRWPDGVSAIDLAVLQADLIVALSATVDSEIEKFLSTVRSKRSQR